MGKDTPETPDFTKLAEQMGLTSRQNVIEQAFANRPNIYTPFGDVTWDRPAYEYPDYLNSGTNTRDTGDGSRPSPAPYQPQSWEQGYDNSITAQPQSGEQGGLSSSRSASYFAPSGATPEETVQYWQQNGGIPGAGTQGTHTVPDYSLGPDGQDRYNGGDWAMHVNLPADMQAALNAQQDITRGRSEFGANTLMGDAYGDYNANKDFWNGLGQMSDPALARNRAEDAIYQRATSRLDPRFEQAQNRLDTQLANQGLTPGSRAYDTQMQNFGRERNDAYQTAMNEAIMGGGAEASRQQAQELQARQQGISEGYQQQYGGLNALNAFLGGQQVNMPGMPSFNTVGQAQTPNYLGAGQSQYGANLNASNIQNAAMNNLMGGAGQMAGMLPFMM